MSNKMSRKRILITGASGGIGNAIARAFAAGKAWLGLHCNSHLSEVSSLLEEIRGIGSDGRIFHGDLLEQSFRNGLIDSFVKLSGGIDVLVNCAGAAFAYRHFSALPEEDWDKTFALNVKVPFYLSGLAVEHMKSHGGGRIINIGSISAKYGGAENGLHYASSKAALESLTRGFARFGAPHGILVNTVRCGLISTDMHSKIPGYGEDAYRRRMKLVPLGRAGTPEEVAAAVLFLASPGAAFITGETITVAGGD